MTTVPDDMVERVAMAICKSKTGEGVHCCQWPGNGGTATCFAAMGNFDDGARAAIDAMQPAILAERERWEHVEEVLFDIEQWCRAYPLKVFPEPDFTRAAELLKAGGMNLDAISASNMRHVLTRVEGMIAAIRSQS